MKRVVYVIAGTLAIGFFAFTLVKRVELRSQQAGFRPFTATLIEDRYTPQGNKYYSEYSIHGVRSDGSYVDARRAQDPDGQWVMRRLVVDLQAKARVTLDPTTQSRLTYPLPDGHVAEMRTPPASCTTAANPQESSLLGYKVIRAPLDFPPTPGDPLPPQVDRSVAPALNCFALRETVNFRSEGVAGAHNEREVLFVTEGEPAAALFEIPSSYVERSPSEMFAEFAKRFPGRTIGPPRTAQVLDQAYQAAGTKH